MVRIVLMYYINLDSFLESPDEDLKRMLEEIGGLTQIWGLLKRKSHSAPGFQGVEGLSMMFSGQ